MQSVSSAFTAEEKDSVRKIGQSLLVSWKKNIITSRTFTIGTSSIGGTDLIGINQGAIGGPSLYQYSDESDYVTSLGWEQELNMPLGGLAKGVAEATLENTTGRFLPHYMGGNSELFTAILPRRPMIINAGFNYEGIDQLIPQFSGVLNKQPEVNITDRSVSLSGADYIDFFQNRYLDQELMFTSKTTDQVVGDLFSSLGMSTAQYDIEQGLNTIDFGLFEKGTRFSDLFNKLAQAENAHIYQDETGVFRFENRQHWYTSPHDQVQVVVNTSDVIYAKSPNEDSIINVVEIKSSIREKQQTQLIYQTQSPIELAPSIQQEYFVSYDDPILQVVSIVITANDAEDGSGTDRSANVTYNKTDFAQASKFIFSNTHTSTIYITSLQINGRPAKIVSEIYHRVSDDSSVTAFEERPYAIENEFIQSETWAQSLGLVLLQSYSDPQSLQEITIRAKPRLQIGDLISWQGRYWRVYGKQTKLDSTGGFVQNLKLLIANTQSFFAIGVSTIGGSDLIAA